MIAKAPGATALYAGAMEVVDDLDALLKNEQHHPFSRLLMDPVRLSTELDTAVPALLLALEKDGLKVEGGWRTRGAYADIHGLARPANIVPATVAGGELKGLVGRRVTVVGVREVGDYDAASTAQALKELHNVEAIPEEVSITELPAGAALTDLYGRRAPSVTNTRAAGRVSAWVQQPAGRRLRAPRLTAVSARMAPAAGDRPGRGACRGGWRAGGWGADRCGESR